MSYQVPWTKLTFSKYRLKIAYYFQYYYYHRIDIDIYNRKRFIDNSQKHKMT